jgi:tetratricopeptide (TPR) repeat protein
MNHLQEAQRLYSASRFLEAEAKLKSALAAEPNSYPAQVMLGIVYVKTSRYSLGIDALSKVLRELPQQYDSMVWLAVAKKMVGDFEEAISVSLKAIELYPDAPAAYNTLGLCYLSSRKVTPAVAAFNRSIALAPRSAAGYHNLGIALRMKDDAYGAIHAFEKSVELEPNHEGNYMQLYRQHLLVSAHYDAILGLEKGLSRLPRSIAIQDALAISYCRTNQKERGEAMFKSILKQKPGFCHSYSLWLQEEGRFEESISLLREWLELEPVQGVAYFCLTEAKSFNFPDGESLVDRALQILDRPKLSSIDVMYLSYALGRAYEQQKEFESAIRHFDRANDLAFQIFNEGRRLDFEIGRQTNDALMTFYSEETVAAYSKLGSQSCTPILIIGMIRSGTTLTDQIVSSHSCVSSAGEQPFWKLEGVRLTSQWVQGEIDPEDIRYLEENYLAVLRGIGGPAARITDKQPLNYEFLGLIHMVFPRAKFIHIRRNPVDTCLSIYTTHFGGGPNFAYKKENIVFHYREYLRLMEHWRKVLPAASLLEVNYEELISNREEVVRNILEFLELPWDESCLHHDKNAYAVATPSRWQARQPVYSTSVDRWRRYEPWLGPLLELQYLDTPSEPQTIPSLN